MKITFEWLKKNDACVESIDLWKKQGKAEMEVLAYVETLMEAKEFKWANWLLARALTPENAVRYAKNATAEATRCADAAAAAESGVGTWHTMLDYGLKLLKEQEAYFSGFPRLKKNIDDYFKRYPRGDKNEKRWNNRAM